MAKQKVVDKGDKADNANAIADAKADKALRTIEKLSEILLGKGKSSKDTVPTHERLRQQAVLLGNKNFFAKALECYAKSLQAYQNSGKNSAGTDATIAILSTKPFFEARTLNEMGCLQSRAGKTEQAVAHFKTAIAKTGEQPGKQTQAAELCRTFTKNLAACYLASGHTVSAIKLYEDLLNKYRGGVDDSLSVAANAAYHLADLHNNAARFSQAEPFARESIKLSQSSAPSPDAALSMCLLAAVISAPLIAKYEEAEMWATKAVEMAKGARTSYTQQSREDAINGFESVLNRVRAARLNSDRRKRLAPRGAGKRVSSSKATAPVARITQEVDSRTANTTLGRGTAALPAAKQTKALKFSKKDAASAKKKIQESRRGGK